MSPHRSRYWLHAKIEDPDQCEQQIEKICEVYLEAVDNEADGLHTVSVDEKTGIQALGRESPTIPMSPSKVERMEYNDERHGTTNLFGNLNVATGKIIEPMLRETRTSEDVAENIDNIVETDPAAKWVFVCDHLNTHMSVSLVMLIAVLCDIPLEGLGKPRKYAES